MTVISLSEARRTLSHQLDLVAHGEEIEISRYGQVVAVLTQPRTHRNPRAEAAIAAAEKIGDLLAAAREEPLIRGGISAERAEELIADIRAGRDAR